MRLRPILIVVAIVSLTNSRQAAADDAGDAAADGGMDADAFSSEEDAASEDAVAGNTGPADSAQVAPAYVSACDGALCDTTTGSQCGVAVRSATSAPNDPALWIVTAGAVAIVGARRTWRRASRPSRSGIAS
jgi:hypothetical protein